MAGSASNKVIKTAVITGGHDFDVVGFHELFRTLPDVNAYPQNMEDFVTDTGGARGQYEVIVFYNYHVPTPGTGPEEWASSMKTALEQLGQSEQGILLLHHAIVAFPQWRLWTDICGIEKRAGIDGFVDQTLRVEPASPQHPITRGLAPWEIVDETYVMDEPGEGSEVMLTTDHPNSMRAIAWARQYGRSRVMCYQSGHDNHTLIVPQFRTVIARGVQWLARRI